MVLALAFPSFDECQLGFGIFLVGRGKWKTFTPSFGLVHAAFFESGPNCLDNGLPLQQGLFEVVFYKTSTDHEGKMQETG